MPQIDLQQDVALQRGPETAMAPLGAMGWRSPYAEADRGESELRFGRFKLMPAARLLLRDDQPVELGARAFDLLHALLRSRGSIVSKGEILRQVWPGTVVDDCNLRFQVAALRKALGDDRDLIKTVSGRGYLFAVEVGCEPKALRVAPLGKPESEPPTYETSARVEGDPTCRTCTGISAGQAVPCAMLMEMFRAVLDEMWRVTLHRNGVVSAADLQRLGARADAEARRAAPGV